MKKGNLDERLSALEQRILAEANQPQSTGFAYMDDPDFIKKLLETPDSELSDYLRLVKSTYLPQGKSP